MKIESLRIKNFKAFKDAKMENIPDFCVIVGANGTGKSTLFSIFEFLKEAFTTNINLALSKIGGMNGFYDIRTKDSTGSIEFEFTFKTIRSDSIIYFLEISYDTLNEKAYIENEKLSFKPNNSENSDTILHFQKGIGTLGINNTSYAKNQKLRTSDTLAIKTFSELEAFPIAGMLAEFIESWSIINDTENVSEQQLIKDINKMKKQHPDTFNEFINQLKSILPEIENVSLEKNKTEGEDLFLKNTNFNTPFHFDINSEGTKKILYYLSLLNKSEYSKLLCIEEPENKLYHSLLYEIAEDFRIYSYHKGQVFIATHSPYFLNATEVNEVFWLEKEDGYTKIIRANQNKQIVDYMNEGDQMGYLWSQRLFGNIDPK